MNEPGVGADWRKQQPDNGDKEQHGPCRHLPHELPIGWPAHEGPETHASNSCRGSGEAVTCPLEPRTILPR